MEAEIPQAMYEVRMDEMVNDFAFRVEQQGLTLENYLKYMGQTMEQFRASFMPQAEKQVKIRLALEAVANAENIEASEEDVSAEIKRIADQYKMGQHGRAEEGPGCQQGHRLHQEPRQYRGEGR